MQVSDKIKSLLLGSIKQLFVSKASAAAKAPPNVVINKVTVQPVNRQSQDIQKWRNALIQAEQMYEQRTMLYDLYSDILLDGRLKSLIEQRVMRITNSNLVFSIDGKPSEDLANLSEKTFFRKFIREALMSRFWGHTLTELYWPAMGSNDKGVTNLIPRKHVKPKRGIVTKNSWDMDGLKYRERPYCDFCIEIGEPDDLGLILEVCPPVIYKRGGFGDWAEFAEVFGMPFRWATYQNETSRGILEQALSQAGAAGFVVAPEDAQLQFFNPTAGSQSNDIFRFLWMACNEEMAVAILGNTMTTQEARNSGYAQSQTHERTQDAVHADDRAFVLSVLNEALMPYLESLGYPVAGGKWSFDDGDGLTLTDRLNIDIKVAGFVPIAQDYWYEKYHLPKPDADEIAAQEEEDTEDEKTDPPPGPGKKKAEPKQAGAAGKKP